MNDKIMKIAIIGSGPSGLYTAILTKKSNPGFDVVVFDKEDKLGKKIYATGNGRCNLLNKNILPSKYNDPDYMADVISKYPHEMLLSTINSWGIEVGSIGDYEYPLSFSASSYVSCLLSLAHKLGIKFLPSNKVFDYSIKNGMIQLNGINGSFDKLIVATGGMSSPRLGSDGSFIQAIKKHGYSFNDFKPGLTPLKVNQRGLKGLQGVRHHASVKAFNDDKEIFAEEGEILFKKDGLSGIVIFNAESAIYRQKTQKHAQILVDLFPEHSENALVSKLDNAKKNNDDYLLSFFVEPLANYIKYVSKNQELRTVAHSMKSLSFDVMDHYPFEDSQVSIGGVDLSEVDEHLQSKREPNVYFVGEILDIDGDCGGYNLAWCLMSALLVSEGISKQ